MRLMKLPDHKRVVTIEPELYSKGWVYAAEDARRQFLIVSQRVKFFSLPCGTDSQRCAVWLHS